MWLAKISSVAVFLALWYFLVVEDLANDWGRSCVVMVSFEDQNEFLDGLVIDPNATTTTAEWDSEVYFCSIVRGAMPFWASFLIAAALPMIFLRPGSDTEQDQGSQDQATEETNAHPLVTVTSNTSVLVRLRLLLFIPGLFIGLMLSDSDFVVSDVDFAIAAAPGLLFEYYAFGFAIGSKLRHWQLTIAVMLMAATSFIPTKRFERAFGMVPFVLFYGLHLAEVSRAPATKGEFATFSKDCSLVVVLSVSGLFCVHEHTSSMFREWFSSIVRFYTFFWVWPTLSKGGVAYEDLPPLAESEDPAKLSERFLIEESRVETGFQLLVLCCYTIQRRTFWTSMLHGWFYLTCMTLDPIMLHALLSSNLDNFRRDLLLAVGLSLSMLLRVSCMEICFFYSVRTMAAARSAMVVSIFEKSFEDNCETTDEEGKSADDTAAKPVRMAGGEAKKENRLDLPNLMSSDADKLGANGWVIFFLASWTFALISLPIYLFILANFVGLAASFAGLSMLIIGGAFTKRIAGMAQPLFLRLQETRDQRSFFVRHALTGMLAIKMFADEARWVSLIQEHRQKEMSTWLKVRYITAFTGIFTSLATIAVPIVVFAWVTKVENKTLDSADAFTTLLIISQISWSIGTLPDIFNLWSNIAPIATRLLQFFRERRVPIAADVDPCTTGEKGQLLFSLQRAPLSSSESQLGLPPSTSESLISAPIIHVRAGTAMGFNKPLFSLPEFVINRGELVLVTGKVGSGKSCLLSVFAGVRAPIKGRVTLASRRAYVEQKPFLLNGSIKDNVLFGEDDRAVDETGQRLNMSLSLAKLDRDLLALPKHVDTLVGDGGVQLSGGQRARVSFARALYVAEGTDLFVLDDLFASIDGDTGRSIWNDAIHALLDEGQKTIVLSSSFPSKEMLARCTIKIDLNKDDITGDVTVTVLKNDHPRFIPYPSHHVTTQTSDFQQTEQRVAENLGEEDHLVTLPEVRREMERGLESRMGRTINAHLVQEMSRELTGQHDDDERDASNRSDLGGTISWLDFFEYWSRFGFDLRKRVLCCFRDYMNNSTTSFWVSMSKFVLFAFILGSALLEILSPFWLAHWTQTEQNGLATYIAIQLGMVMASQISFIILTWCALGASQAIHEFAVKRLINAPMSVFDSVPAGRLLNILSGDLRSIDEGLPDNGYNQLRRTIVALFQIAIIAVYAKMVLPVLPFLFLVYRFILHRVRGPARDVKRIEAAANAPVYTAFLDALKGRRTIKAFGKEDQFCVLHARKAKRMATARVANEAIGKWAQALAVQTGCLLYFACGVVGVVTMYEEKDKQGSFGVATLALLLTFAGILQRTGMDLMMGWTSFESSLVSIERMASLMRLPVEEHPNEQTLSDSGLTKRVEYPVSIEFRDVRLRYRLYRPLVLKGMSFFLPGGSKAAIVGRSGGGKSSLFQALLRVYPLCGGQILLGGLDVADIPLRKLRNGMENGDVRVVLQDALLPQPTLRGNIDANCSDYELRSVLKRVGLQSPRFQTNMDLNVGVGGSLLSAGERQLVCLARAVIGSPKLLLCDECTSFVDETVDEQVHRELLSLQGVTLLSILHRTVHLGKFDYIIEVAAGRIVRVDHLTK